MSVLCISEGKLQTTCVFSVMSSAYHCIYFLMVQRPPQDFKLVMVEGFAFSDIQKWRLVFAFVSGKNMANSVQVLNRGAVSRGHCRQSRGNETSCWILGYVLLYVWQWQWEATCAHVKKCDFLKLVRDPSMGSTFTRMAKPWQECEVHASGMWKLFVPTSTATTGQQFLLCPTIFRGPNSHLISVSL